MILVGDKKEKSSLEELKGLTTTAGGEVLEVIPLRVDRITPSLFIGEGQAEEIRRCAEEKDANLVVFDMELHPVQQRNLEKIIGRRVIDRTQVIMDIFAQHAYTEEGKIEVELAQLKYLLPRLTGKGKELSRLGGGIGTRGPGERKLEYDRRKIQVRIKRLEKKLHKLILHRDNIGRRRRKSGLPLGAIVGYTNAGKTSLINALTRSHLPAGNRLFMTLDTRMRKLYLPNNQLIILTDTVGFIRRLPAELLASFKATLEETIHASFLLHIIDASSPEREKMKNTVKRILKELSVLDKPVIEIFNKVDLLNQWEKRRLAREYPESLQVSSLTGEGLEELKVRIVETLRELREEVDVFLPSDKFFLLSEIHQNGEVLSELPQEGGMRIRARLDKPLAEKIKGLVESADG